MASDTKEILIPDIGGAVNVDVIEVLVKPGDQLNPEDPLVTLEGDKATMEIPAPEAGIVKALKIAVGDKVSEGSPILELEVKAISDNQPKQAAVSDNKTPVVPEETTFENRSVAKSPEAVVVHASPAVRRIAHELDVDLTQVPATGQKGRITKDDIKNYLKSGQTLAQNGGVGLGVAPMPSIDFSKFGPVETTSLTKIQKMSGANLHRNWVSIPHVTQFGEADITEMEAFRQKEKDAALRSGVRLTPLVFLMKAAVAALKAFPHFNASLDPSGNQLVLKHYYHIGVAVDTPKGLVVPVIRDVDQKGLLQLAKELGDVSVKAREKGLSMADMQGGCFSVSSLGGIGGTAFTPIINAPEVAILGVSRTKTKPTYIDGVLCPRLMLPLSLSYDHRVIDGADGARFMMYFQQRLSDLRTLLL